MKLLQITSLWLLSINLAFSQEYSNIELNPALIAKNRLNTQKLFYLHLRVIDPNTNEYLEGIKLRMLPQGASFYTDAKGEVIITLSSNDTFSLELTLNGYTRTIFRRVCLPYQYNRVLLPLEPANHERTFKEIKFEPNDVAFHQESFKARHAIVSKEKLRPFHENTLFELNLSPLFRRSASVSQSSEYSSIRSLQAWYHNFLLNGAPWYSLENHYASPSSTNVPLSLLYNLQIIKNTTSEQVSQYGSALLNFQSYPMLPASFFQVYYNFTGISATSFQSLFSQPINRRLLFVPEIQNITLKKYTLDHSIQPLLPNQFAERNYKAPLNQQIAWLFNHTTHILNNKPLIFNASFQVDDLYERINFIKQIPQQIRNQQILLSPLTSGEQNLHQQLYSATLGTNLQLNTRNFWYSHQFFQYKNKHLYYVQQNPMERSKTQNFERYFSYALQNKGEHYLINKKGQSLAFFWNQFYHYYYAQTPITAPMFFSYHDSLQTFLLDLPSNQSSPKSNEYNKNLIFSAKQQVQQVGGNAYFDILFKEEFSKAKTRIGAFWNYTRTNYQSRQFLYMFSNPLIDSSQLGLNWWQQGYPIIPNNEQNFQNTEQTDSFAFFRSSFYQFAPFVSVHYEFYETFHLVLGLREEIILRKGRNLSEYTNIDFAVQSDLPSIALLFWLNSKSLLRFNYSSSTVFPDDRALLAPAQWNPWYQVQWRPNPSLYHSSINHFELSFAHNSSTLSQWNASLFFKHIKFPLEWTYSIPSQPNQVLTAATQNANAALLMGLEMQLKQNLNDWFHFSANHHFLFQANAFFSLSQAKTEHGYRYFSNLTRPLQGSPFYNFNASFNYEYLPWAFRAAIFLNHRAKSILFASEQKSQLIWELPNTQIDIQLSKAFSKHWEVRFAAINLLNPPQRWVLLSHYNYFSHKIQSTLNEFRIPTQWIGSLVYRL